MSLCETLKTDVIHRHKSLFETMPIGCLVVDLAGNIVDVNPRALEILGSPSADETKKINMLTFKPLIDAGVTAITIRSLGGESKIVDDIQYTSCWNKTAVIRFTATPIYDELGYVCMSLLMMEDLTDYNSLKCELERNNKMLKTIIDNIPSLIWMKDVDGKYLHANKAYQTFCDFTGQDVVGKTDKELWDNPEQYIEADNQAMQCDYPVEVTEQVPHPTLGHRWYHTTKVGVCDCNNVVIGTVGISCDVTRRYEQNEILKKALMDLTSSLSNNQIVT